MRSLLIAALLLPCSFANAAPITTVDELVASVAEATPGSLLEIAPGTFALREPLVVPAGVTVTGAGTGETILTHDPAWQGNPATLPDPETNRAKFDDSSYLIHLANKASDIEIAHLTLTGPGVHGAIFSSNNTGIRLHHLEIRDFMYCGIRSFGLRESTIHHCTFIDASQRWKKGEPGVQGGITGGGIFCIWTQDTEIAHNRFLDTQPEPNRHFYGIKGRQGKRLRIHHNTIETNFSIEFPFENDEDIEIAHNILHGAISIPKHLGGSVPPSGRTFHIHHNYSTSGYAIEFVRNGVEIDHNLFDFDPAKDGGNLISGFGKDAAPGPAIFHNNLVNNPGRGVIWINGPYSNFIIRNNHIIARTTSTPRTEGLFGFHQGSGFATIQIIDNIVECIGQPRPLLRSEAAHAATIRNNVLSNVADSDRFPVSRGVTPAGPLEPLSFTCGVEGELTIHGWETRPTTSP